MIGIDAGEAEQVADERADGGAAAARRQVVLVGVAHELPVAEEEARLLGLTHQVELVADALASSSGVMRP